VKCESDDVVEVGDFRKKTKSNTRWINQSQSLLLLQLMLLKLNFIYKIE